MKGGGEVKLLKQQLLQMATELVSGRWSVTRTRGFRCCVHHWCEQQEADSVSGNRDDRGDK